MGANALTVKASVNQPPDIVIHFEQIKQRTTDILREVTEAGFSEFPIDREKLLNSTIETIFPAGNGNGKDGDLIWHIITLPSGATIENHNELRTNYSQSRLSAGEAKKVGLFAAQIPVEFKCSDDYDWKSSRVYNGIKDCEQISKMIKGKKIPTTVYLSKMNADEAKNLFANPDAAPFYTRYEEDGQNKKAGPIACVGPLGEKCAFHRTYVSPVWSSVDFILAGTEGRGWTSWSMRRSCTENNGKSHAPADLYFDFGIRAFVPVYAKIDGVPAEYTIIITQAAAASASIFAGLIPESLPFERMFGGEFAKKIFLEGIQNIENNWVIRR